MGICCVKDELVSTEHLTTVPCKRKEKITHRYSINPQDNYNQNPQQLNEIYSKSKKEIQIIPVPSQKKQSELINGKESADIREISNCMSDNFSLFQEKEKIFPGDVTDKLSSIDANLCQNNNFELTCSSNNIQSFNSKQSGDNSRSTQNMKKIIAKSIRKNEFHLLDTVKETMRENDKIVVSNKVYKEDSFDHNSQNAIKHTFNKISQATIRNSTQSNGKTPKKISLIPVNSSMKNKTEWGTKKTMTTESNMSTERFIDQKDTAVNSNFKARERFDMRKYSSQRDFNNANQQCKRIII